MLVKSPKFNLAIPSQINSTSLSDYFPSGTSYFYGYPSGEESGFLNRVPPAVEELVSARPLVCAGEDITVIAFANAVRSQTMDFIQSSLGPIVDKAQIHKLPSYIDGKVVGKERNEHVKYSLKQFVRPGSLVMAQPFLDDDLKHLYQISPRLTTWLNDKKHMHSYIPKELIPKRYATYTDGKEFYKAHTAFLYPCVVKVSSSSAGDGVYICSDQKILQKTKRLLKNIKGVIFVEQYIETKINYGIQFGIPHNRNLPIDIIGISEQLTTSEGEFIGGIIDATTNRKELDAIKETLLTTILPQVRALGWYGVGCFDVLLDPSGKTYIIDCNFRMTGMTAFFMLAANGHINKSMVTFGGEFRGTPSQLYKRTSNVLEQGQNQKACIITLTETEGICRFNGAILFNNRNEINDTAKQLKNAGVLSKVLDFFS